MGQETGDKQVALTCEKAMLRAVWNKINNMQTDVSTVGIWILFKNVETSRGETVDGRNIQTLQHTLC